MGDNGIRHRFYGSGLRLLSLIPIGNAIWLAARFAAVLYRQRLAFVAPVAFLFPAIMAYFLLSVKIPDHGLPASLYRCLKTDFAKLAGLTTLAVAISLSLCR